MAIGIELRGTEDELKKVIMELVKSFSSSLLMTISSDKEIVSKQTNLLFRTYNIEHTGHNIAQ
jgi:hypothetical protein